MVSGDGRGTDRTDGELVVRARAGDSEAFDELVVRHHGSVYRWALGILGEEAGAQDVAQETFLKAWRGLNGFGGRSSFRTWLLTIAANEARRGARRSARRREISLDGQERLVADSPSPDQQVVVRSEVKRVLEAVDALPDKQRLSVSLRILEGLGFREIGQVLGSSEGAARANYHYGIKRMRDLLR